MAVAVVESVYGFATNATGLRRLGVEAIGSVGQRCAPWVGRVAADDHGADCLDGMPDELSGGVRSSIQLRVGRVCVDLPRLICRLALAVLLSWAVFVVIANFLSVSNEPILPGAIA